MSADASVVRWYDEKTDWLVKKYGPGPRIHFHTGLVQEGEVPATSSVGIAAQIVASQERMLDRVADVWLAPERFPNHTLVDVGCGLGGTAIAFAERFGCRVRGVTPVPRHVELVQQLAAQAGVGHLVTGEVADASTVPGQADGAYAIGASNYFDRFAWFRRMAEVLPSGAWVGVEDTFLVDPELKGPFDDYWISNVGTRAEYEAAARQAGFHLAEAFDATADAARFYRLNVAYSQALLDECRATGDEIARRQRSIAWQARFAEGYEQRGFEDWILRFQAP